MQDSTTPVCFGQYFIFCCDGGPSAKPRKTAYKVPIYRTAFVATPPAFSEQKNAGFGFTCVQHYCDQTEQKCTG